VRRLAETLDLITFFTAGEKETRAWTLRRGQTAIEAAGTIHTDIARGFIRCEVIRWDDLVAAGSHSEVSRAGKQRLEGKTYVVDDGDVLNIRFNV
jgi:ribosome-binding ATPase YchF (GTP1/OBG family)